MPLPLTAGNTHRAEVPPSPPTHMVQDVNPIGPLCWLPIMHYVCNEVIGCVLVHGLHFLRQVFPEIHVPAAEREATVKRPGFALHP